jgi:hypothetical protein
MERLLPFQFDSTCYLVVRQGEWAIFVRIADAGNDGIHFDIDFTDRTVANILNPQRFTFPVNEGMSLDMERVDGTEEEVVIWSDSMTGGIVTMGFELPEGVTITPFDSEPATG